MSRVRSLVLIAAAVPALMSGFVVPASAKAAPPRFANCDQMHRKYPHGVGRAGARDHVKGHTAPVKNFYVSTAIYNANTGRDGDHDGVACEKR